MISGEEFARRMRRVAQMRTLILNLRQAALRAHREGRIPFRPRIDPRSDADHWRPMATETSGSFSDNW